MPRYARLPRAATAGGSRAEIPRNYLDGVELMVLEKKGRCAFAARTAIRSVWPRGSERQQTGTLEVRT
jgi:hypothetical protein